MRQVWEIHHDDDGWWAEVPGNGDLVAFSDSRQGLDEAIDWVIANQQRRPVVAKCTESCKKPTPAQAHCSLCHITFGGIRGFDIHRRGGTCSDPSTFGFVERDRVWRDEVDQEKIAVFKDRVRGTRGKS